MKNLHIPRREALLHELENAGHTGALQLREDRAALELARHHVDVGLDEGKEGDCQKKELMGTPR